MNSRRKGKVGEREFAALLREHGFEARRGQQFSGGAESPDVVCEQLSWIHFEVKRVQNLNLTDACAQAEGDCGGKPWAVAHRKNHAPWLITVRAETFFDLLREKSSHSSHGSHRSFPKAASDVGKPPVDDGENYLPTVGMQDPQTPLSTKADDCQTETFTDVLPIENAIDLGSAGAQPDCSKQNN